MVQKKKILILLLAAAAMLVMILDSRTAIHGAAQGITLCLETVIPSLFPMMILSSILTQGIAGKSTGFLRPIETLCGIPPGSAGVYLTGLIGGYPIGAKCVSDAYRKKYLSRNDANHLLSFCNNPGPSFIFGICSPLFSSNATVWALWVIQIVSSMVTGFILRKKAQKKITWQEQRAESITQVVTNCVHAMAMICGWIIIFRVIIAFLRIWFLWLLPEWIQVLLSGMLELTNGCCMLSQIQQESVRFLICSIMLCFGGMCVGMQTTYVTTGLSNRSYLNGKLIQTAVTIVLSVLMSSYIFPHSAYPGQWLLLLLSAFIIFFLTIIKINIAFSKKIRYNTDRNYDKRSCYAVSKKNRASLFLLPVRSKSG